MNIAEIARLAKTAPELVKLVTSVQKATQGDAEAIGYLTSDGWVQALNIARPGAGDVGRQVLDQLKDAALGIQGTLQGNVIESTAREVTYPWHPFLLRLISQPNSSHIILGPTGAGKTTLAMRLAQRLSEHSGYKVECCNVYQDDIPPFASAITMETLTARMARLSKYLKAQARADLEDEPVEEDDVDEYDEDPSPRYRRRRRVSAPAGPATLPPQGRVIVIDEAILAMGSNVNDPGRKAALQALAQCRHLRWHVIYIGQWAGQLPLPLLGQAVLWVKKPNGRESLTDRDHPVVRDLWERTLSGFDNLKRSPHFQEPWGNDKSWAFCDCQSLNGGAGYSGMVPFTPVDMAIEGEFHEVAS